MLKQKIKNTLILVTFAVFFLHNASVFAEDFNFSGDSYGNGVVEDSKEFFSDIGDFLGVDGKTGSSTSTSFTDFKGGLQAPSPEGYSQGLVQATDAKTYIKNVTNFILGFLGFIAILIVIYGGFLYVTDAGKGEQTEKGKKAIQYAMIGIVIILGSFALVNTILLAPQGTDQQLKGSAETGKTTTENAIRRFNYLAARVQTMAKDVLTSYAFHFEAKKDLKTAHEIVQKALERINECKDKGCGDNWSQGLKEELDKFPPQINNAVNILQKIRANIPKNSVDTLTVDASLGDIITYLDNMWGPAIDRAARQADQNGCSDDITEGCDVDNVNAKVENRAVYAAFLNVSASEQSPGSTFLDSPLYTDFEKSYEAANTAVLGNFEAVTNSQKMKIKEMYDAVRPVTNVADPVFGNLVTLAKLQEQALFSFNALDEASGSIETLKISVRDFQDQTPGKESPPSQNLKQVLTDLSELFKFLQSINFVDVKLTASTVSGNAPLIVNFSSVGSLDPSGVTIQDGQIEWDLDGNDNFNGNKGQPATNKFLNCKEEAKTTISCAYKTPGTYRVKLRIKPTDQTNPVTNKKYSEEIGSGIATVDIKVNPPETKINLSMKAGDESPKFITRYNENGFLEIDRQSIIVPLSKAQQGIVFDASATKTGDTNLSDQVNEGARVLWDFGDSSIDDFNGILLEATSGNLAPPPHKYQKEGTYNVRVEVTNKNRVVDRKIFTLIVSTLAPDIDISIPNAKVGEEVTFDGSNSVSDNGQINSWEWKFSPPLENTANLTKDSLKYSFKKPEKYLVTLKIGDGLKSAETSTEFFIESEPPVAQFIVMNDPSSAQPATFEFDATRSYDPDSEAVIDYEWEIDGQTLQKKFKQDDIKYSYDTTDPVKLKVKFKQKGSYKIALTAIDPNGGGQGVAQSSQPLEKEITVENTLDIAWGTNDNPSSLLKENPLSKQSEAEMDFTLLSEKANSYEIDFGDGKKENGSMPLNKPVKHLYKETGTFVVKASVFDEEDNENTLNRKVFIGSSQKPTAAIGIKVNGQEQISTLETLKIKRGDVISFDAGKSRNTDGTGRRLNYSWDFGDNERSTKEQSTHTYKELGDYKVSLKVTNANEVSQNATDTVQFTVQGEPPLLRGLTAVSQTPALVTPVTVQLKAVDAEDKDGQIVQYRWWYYDPNNDSDELGVLVTTSPTANIVIGTRGNENEEKTYKFGVELKDNENNLVKSSDVLDLKLLPSLTVKNGPNKAPVAKFTVDRTSILVGETINFTSTSADPDKDGSIKALYWDFEGDGFANNTKAESSTVSHTYTKAAKEGIKVRLRVRDNNESESTSDPITVYIDGKADEPVAAFTSNISGKKVTFTNNSSADKANGATIIKHIWDFDTAKDSDGNGKKADDIDSTDQNPTYEYADYGIFNVGLTIFDTEGNEVTQRNFVNVKAPVEAPVPKPSAPTPQAPAEALDARLLSIPAASTLDGKIHLKGQTATVTFVFSSSKGDIKSYSIDKNIYFDSNGNGVKDDDQDYKSSVAGQWTTGFEKSLGAIRVRLTVIDSKGKKDSVDKEIIFDLNSENLFAANIFGSSQSEFISVIIATLGIAIIAALYKKNKSQHHNNAG